MKAKGTERSLCYRPSVVGNMAAGGGWHPTPKGEVFRAYTVTSSREEEEVIGLITQENFFKQNCFRLNKESND